MKFTTAWANIATENVVLKFAIAFTVLSSIVLAICATRLALRPPIVIERSCFSQAVSPANAARSQSEIETFTRLALMQRFNSDVRPLPGYLSKEEEAHRVAEQTEMGNRKMTQTILPRAIGVDGNKITVEADRLIAIGTIRSAFRFPLTAEVLSVPRSESNPYGLTLTKIIPTKTEESK